MLSTAMPNPTAKAMTDENTIVSTINTATGYNRCYHDGLPAKVTLPASVVQRISTIPNHTHDGDAFDKVRYQVTPWAETKAACLTLASTIKTALNRNMSDVELSLFENQISLKDPETGLYYMPIDFFVWE